MPVPTSELFDFLCEYPSCRIDRHELFCRPFSGLRRCVRQIVIQLREADDVEGTEFADGLRVLISEWLTVPVGFDGSMLEALRNLGGSAQVERRWGRDIRRSYDESTQYAADVRGIENPMRSLLSGAIRGLQESGTLFRVYCHPQARRHFESLIDHTGLTSAIQFIHSVAQYRETSPFDVLLKAGPLRSRGWGSAPDAILTAPRFHTLVQPVWAGCADESGFGYDPVSVASSSDDSAESVATSGGGTSPLRISWERNRLQLGDADPSAPTIPDVDELEVFRQLDQGEDFRRATFVQLTEEQGMLFSPHSRVLSFDPAASRTDSIDWRLPEETLQEGMYVVLPVLDDASLGGSRAEDGRYSSIWKKALSDALLRDASDLVRRLRDDGIELRGLRSRLEHWRRPASGVIHAPQQMRHFEILVRVLGTDLDALTPDAGKRVQGWRYAWDEIRRARGEAIHIGFVEQQIVNEALVAALRPMIDLLRSKAESARSFELTLPSEMTLSGVVRFLKVHAIEPGFLVPPTEMGVVIESAAVNQWRN